MSSDKFTKVKTCHYTILGIKKDATDIEIKKAYKKLAMKYHPDRNMGDKEFNEKKFKEINEAYSVLSDQQTKLNYDNFGFQENGGNFQNINPNDIFMHIFGNMNGGGHPFVNINGGGGHPFINMNGGGGGHPFINMNGGGNPFINMNGGGNPFINMNGGHPFVNMNGGGNPFSGQTFTFINRNM